MSTGGVEIGFSVARPSRPAPSLPGTGAAALNGWVRSVQITVLLQIAAASAGAAFQRRPFDPTDAATAPVLHAMLGALLLALLVISLARHAERRQRGRPPRQVLALHLGLYAAGSAAATTQLLTGATTRSASLAFYAIGHGGLALSTLVFLAWFVSALVASAPAAEG